MEREATYRREVAEATAIGLNEAPDQEKGGRNDRSQTALSGPARLSQAAPVDIREWVQVDRIEDLARDEAGYYRGDALDWKAWISKPCVSLRWCPYSLSLMSAFPSSIDEARALGIPVDNVPLRCVGSGGEGRHCPAFYLARDDWDECAVVKTPEDCVCCEHVGLDQCPRGDAWRREAWLKGMKIDWEHHSWLEPDPEDLAAPVGELTD